MLTIKFMAIIRLSYLVVNIQINVTDECVTLHFGLGQLMWRLHSFNIKFIRASWSKKSIGLPDTNVI